MEATLLSLLLLAGFLTGCTSHDLPAIADPNQLVSDCTILLSAKSDRSIDSADWPASVRSLNPVFVQRGSNYIMIETFADTGVSARGYLVSSSTSLDIARYKITATSSVDLPIRLPALSGAAGPHGLPDLF